MPAWRRACSAFSLRSDTGRKAIPDLLAGNPERMPLAATWGRAIRRRGLPAFSCDCHDRPRRKRTIRSASVKPRARWAAMQASFATRASLAIPLRPRARAQSSPARTRFCPIPGPRRSASTYRPSASATGPGPQPSAWSRRPIPVKPASPAPGLPATGMMAFPGDGQDRLRSPGPHPCRQATGHLSGAPVPRRRTRRRAGSCDELRP